MEKTTIKVLEVIEQEDGGATIKLELSPNVIESFVEYAITDILTKAAKNDFKHLNLFKEGEK